jgi:hypothetical protein
MPAQVKNVVKRCWTAVKALAHPLESSARVAAYTHALTKESLGC